MTVGELTERAEFLRGQRVVLKRLVDENEKESFTLLTFLREQGVESLSKRHEHRCPKEHEHTPGCCARTCWCQRDLQGPTKVG